MAPPISAPSGLTWGTLFASTGDSDGDGRGDFFATTTSSALVRVSRPDRTANATSFSISRSPIASITRGN